MYKVLITTAGTSPSYNVHTIVVEFSNPGDAQVAARIINNDRVLPSGVSQHARLLFDAR